MEFSLKREVDFKLLYDSLADPSNGMIKLTTLTTRWPRAASKLPRGLPEQWRAAADDNGYLDWERFSSALNKALEEEKPRLSKTEAKEEKSFTHHAGQPKSGALAPRVVAEEIELFLSSCRGDILAKALSRTRKEVYKCQMSLHQLESLSRVAGAQGKNGKKSDPPTTNGRVKVLYNIRTIKSGIRITIDYFIKFG